jgi:DNA-directed RNA polymerase sigma subunit (sigma70/sigma32)
LGNGDIFFIEDTILDNLYFVEKNIGKEETIKYIDEIIARNFCPSDYKIIVGRFGLNGEKIKSLKELSEELEISLESVRLRENIIKRKLKLNPEIIELQYNMERFENVN